VIATRIDHLSPEGRDLIRKASVFARSSFTVAELDDAGSPSQPRRDGVNTTAPRSGTRYART
jgi:hypothetical protein